MPSDDEFFRTALRDQSNVESQDQPPENADEDASISATSTTTTGSSPVENSSPAGPSPIIAAVVCLSSSSFLTVAHICVSISPYR